MAFLIKPLLFSLSFTDTHILAHTPSSVTSRSACVDVHLDACLLVKGVWGTAGMRQSSGTYQYSKKVFLNRGGWKKRQVNQAIRNGTTDRTRNILSGFIWPPPAADSQVTAFLHLLLIPPQMFAVMAAKLFSRLPLCPGFHFALLFFSLEPQDQVKPQGKPSHTVNH